LNTIEVCILFADLEGFTAFTEAHGDHDAAYCAGRFYELAEAVLIGDARVIKTIGDAVMIVSSAPAIVVSIALNLGSIVDAEPEFPAIRAGLHSGPAVERGGDYFGAAVNLAARVTAYARSGQILCTEAVAAAIRDMPDIELHAEGLAHLKNIAQPVALFALERTARLTSSRQIDPVCHMRLDPELAPARLPYGDKIYPFCSFGCAQKFAQSPETYHVP
jgi:adenylate cyclase